LIRALAAAPGRIEEAEARAAAGPPPFPAAGIPRAEALLADHARVAAARLDPRIAALEAPGLEEAAATLAQPGGLFGFLSGERRAAEAALDAALRDRAALPALLEARAALRRAAGTDPAALRAGLDWHRRFGAVPEAPAAALDAARQACAALGLEARGPFAALAERLAALAAEAEALPGWRAWLAATDAAPELAPLATALADGSLPPAAAQPAFERALLEGLWRAATRAHPALAAFDGAAMDRAVESFAAADAARVRLAQQEARAAHHARIAALRGDRADAAMAFLRGEFERRRGHAPIRTLLLRGAEVVRAAKPVLMMSPLAVAQHLPSPHHPALPGLPPFDLVVMDEASQIEPVDAFGAIARARQVVVVGDDRQMPPTRFFQRLLENEEEAAAPEGDVQARDVESILGLCNARGLPRALLRWHYRSRHESLIAVSNAEFYEGRLLVLPSPRPRSAALGLSLVAVEGVSEGGVNAAEAAAVAEAVLRHARDTPGETLGVAAFSVVQRDAILEALEARRRASPETEAFFAAHPHEPFFVKNLENVQGDERDAILISVGYGRGRDGRLAMRFGPLSTEGGERRLNVLITRARRRCVAFSGLRAEEVDLSRAGGRGVAALKAFLAFAAATEEARAGRRADTPLAALLEPVVGPGAVAGLGTPALQVDLALRGPDGGYAWGIEADGADFAGLRCARDRHHGWSGALRGMGWKLSQVWAADWLERPREAEARLRAALGLEAAPEAAAPADPGLAAPYAECAPELPGPADSLPFATLAGLYAQVVEAEAPVPEDVVLARIGAPPAAAAQALALAAKLHGLRKEGAFWLGEAAPAFAPRDRRAAHPLLRRAAAVHPREVEAAARALLAARPATTEAEAAAGVARLLGLEAGSEPALAARLAMLAGSGALSFAG
ncbi:AAA domain-containing protein, partial [Roseococcus sp. DSY-14]|uniref:AAA domain-containing protein n=1 Tax=Roseococcus sp. DSY-14 TaxID=3369650 RepID=UPI00387AE2CD